MLDKSASAIVQESIDVLGFFRNRQRRRPSRALLRRMGDASWTGDLGILDVSTQDMLARFSSLRVAHNFHGTVDHASGSIDAISRAVLAFNGAHALLEAWVKDQLAELWRSLDVAQHILHILGILLR
ncbi:hypothetical protein CAC42_3665 [Sphaceloma murrayae]|uniref:Uncharacterized protein n=1 Tax=Sphaceloma murrayae TaxID=2082308 RepID=A0A2K1QPT8_9PEZI|nr:hypothetical protein CAC42_3665 [Sphaceloma murrayae]